MTGSFDDGSQCASLWHREYHARPWNGDLRHIKKTNRPRDPVCLITLCPAQMTGYYCYYIPTLFVFRAPGESSLFMSLQSRLISCSIPGSGSHPDRYIKMKTLYEKAEQLRQIFGGTGMGIRFFRGQKTKYSHEHHQDQGDRPHCRPGISRPGSIHPHECPCFEPGNSTA